MKLRLQASLDGMRKGTVMVIRVCVVSIIALAVSGCGASSGDGKAGTQAAAEASTRSCSLLTEADIKEVTGLDIQSVSQEGAMCM
jgi:Flp pilus assembly protein TadD